MRTTAMKIPEGVEETLLLMGVRLAITPLGYWLTHEIYLHSFVHGDATPAEWRQILQSVRERVLSFPE